MKRSYDVVVVGSGYGGGVAALRAAEATHRDSRRLSVCVLERGREFAPGEFPVEEASFLRELNTIQQSPSEPAKPPGTEDPDPGEEERKQQPRSSPVPQLKAGGGGENGKLFDYYAMGGLDALVGSGLGGTSLVNAAVAMWPDDEVFAPSRGWPIQYGEPRYLSALKEARDRALKELGAVTHKGASQLPKNKAHASYFSDCEQIDTPLTIPTLDPDNPNEIGLNRCVQCGDCTSGCNYGAKATVADTYLKRAVRAGAEAFCEIQVRRIERRRSGLWRIIYTPLSTGNAPDVVDYVETELVVLAAGVLGTTRILDASRSEPHHEPGAPQVLGRTTSGLRMAEALPHPPAPVYIEEFSANKHLGTRFSSNGDLLALAYNAKTRSKAVGLGSRSPIYGGCVGPTATSTYRLKGLDAQVQDGAIPGMFASAQRLLPWRSPRKSTGEALKRKLMTILLGAHRGAADNTHAFLTMGHDGELHNLELDGWRSGPRLTKRPASDWYDKVAAELQRRAEAQGATYLPGKLILSGLTQERLTVHPLGGCAMADNGASGVTDHLGRVFVNDEGPECYSGLMVADASLVPNSLGVNPFLTVAAIAEHNVPQVLAKIFGPSEPATSEPSTGASTLTLERHLVFTETMSGRIARTETDGRPGIALPIEFLARVKLGPLCAAAPGALEGGMMTAVLSGQREFWRINEGATLRLFKEQPELDTSGGTNEKRVYGAGQMVYRGSVESQTGTRLNFRMWKDVLGPGASLVPEVYGTTQAFIRFWRDGETGQDFAFGRLRVGPEDALGMANTARVEPTASLSLHRWLLGTYCTTKRFMEMKAQDDEPPISVLQEWLSSDDVWEKTESAILDSLEYLNGTPQPSREPVEGTDTIQGRRENPLGLSPEYFRVRARNHGRQETYSCELLTDNVRLVRLSRGTGVYSRTPVILAPGLGVSSRSLHPVSAEVTLASTLLERGHDVWLFDYRSSPDLDGAKQPFTLQDIALKDWPFAVDFVCNATGARPTVFAHCLGAYTLLWGCARNSKLRSQVRAAVCSQVGLFLPASWMNLFKALVTTALGPRGILRLQHLLLGDETIDAREALPILQLPPELDAYLRVVAELWEQGLLDDTIDDYTVEQLTDWSFIQGIISERVEAATGIPRTGAFVPEPNGFNVVARIVRTLMTAFRSSMILTHRSVLKEFFISNPDSFSTDPSVNPLDDFLAKLPLVDGERHENAGLRRIFGIFGPAARLKNLTKEMTAELNEMFGDIHVEALRDVAEHLSRGGQSFGAAVPVTGSTEGIRRTVGDDYLKCLKNLQFPISFVSASENRTFLPQGIEDTVSMLRWANPDMTYPVEMFEGFGHMDCLLSSSAEGQQVISRITDLIESCGAEGSGADINNDRK